MVLETTDSGWFAYGPFSSTLHATAYWHEVASVLTLTDLKDVYILPVDIHDELPTNTADTADTHLHKHINDHVQICGVPSAGFEPALERF